MKTILKALLMLLIVQIAVAQKTEEFPKIHTKEWEKMNASKKPTIDWFKDSKYGMFIHWGLYSLQGGIWKGKKMEEMRPPFVAEWIMHAAQVSRNEYKKLANEFNPVKFNADSIAFLAKEAGMKYLVITSKHHDGFALYDSKVSDFDVMNTPFKRDIISELQNACNKQGIAFGIYYSHNIDWMDGSDAQSVEFAMRNPDASDHEKTFGANTWDPSPNTFDDYLQKKAFPQVKELMQNYPGMKMLWYDMPWRMKPEQSFTFYKIVYDLQPQIIITERIGNGFGDYFIPGDNVIPDDRDKITKPWETVGTHNNSWGYKSYDNDWKTPDEILYWLLEIVSRGGNYMLNIGPTSEGVVPDQSVYNLLEVGKWLKINGEAVYGTRKWKITKEGSTQIQMKGTGDRKKQGFKNNFAPEDFWFTEKNGKVYAIAIKYPESEALIKCMSINLVGNIKSAKMLGSQSSLSWEQTDKGLKIKLPRERPNKYGYVIEISL
ncbi:alpha-L-fucosidase [Maribellus comscasis]|uniref:alpha-L-fucosidase n=1 Tax=Maribellus comscasis TaxID=2681766 RepID=A0A6I6JNI3_9BACT|nr:alpha-L-fucosidase [Maribellus comscasis]QGY42540.1 alpha-L-fucosidase [Maribellus comscasis]